ncbi:MAG: serine/threonine protein kinase [Vicinamibacteria bacterium]|nr:serine/threonine protein kinase [Vicinamibacteria bacterium]
MAAELFAEAGMPFQAAKCYRELGDSERSLDYFVRVPRRDDQYRKAVVEAVLIASEMGGIGVQLEQFLTDFIDSGPQDDREMEAFYLLGRLYVDIDFAENAEDVFEAILTQDPDYRDVVARLAALRQQCDGRNPELDKVLKDDVAFWETDTGSDLRRFVKKPPPPADLSSKTASGRTMPFVAGPHGTVVLPAAVSRASFEVGSIIAGRYRIDEMIGRGGMATVFRANDLELGEEVALKLFSQPIDDEAGLARFRQELKLSRMLVHPNIVRLYDIGAYSGFRYITMELLVGEVLEKLLERPMPLRRGLKYLLQACAALKTAHDNGVVHRDLKPSNLFVTRDDCLKVMDFGIAKHQTAPGLTAVGMLAGTPEYMSPEQINDFSTVTAATDLYALGVVAYEMFTGRRPFESQGLGELLHMHLKRAPESPRRRSPEMPEMLDRIILKLLAKQPEQRFADCEELSVALEQVREHLTADD